MLRLMPVHGERILDGPAHLHCRVVPEILANAGQLVPDLDTECAERQRWSNTRQQQQVWGPNSASTKDDLGPVHLGLLSLACELHACGPRPRKEQAMDHTIGPDGQIGALSDLVGQIASGRAIPDAV